MNYREDYGTYENTKRDCQVVYTALNLYIKKLKEKNNPPIEKVSEAILRANNIANYYKSMIDEIERKQNENC